MKKILLGPVHYFKKKSYIKGVLWLLLIVCALFANFFLALLFWLFAGWIGRKMPKANHTPVSTPITPVTPITSITSATNQSPDPQYTESTSPKKDYSSSSDFPEVDDKGMKILKVLDGVKLSGVTKEFEGINPQETIERLSIGEEVFFRRISMKKYPNATLVVDCIGDPIGWIPEDFAYQEDIAKRIDDGTTVKGTVNDILGGEDGKSYGVRVDIARYEKKRAKRQKEINGAN